MYIFFVYEVTVYATVPNRSGPPRLKLGRAKELWAKASIRGALDAPPRLARIKKSLRRVVKSSEDENENDKDEDEDEGVKGNNSDEEERELNQPSGVGESELASGAEKDTEAGPSQHVTVSEANAPEMPSEEEENLTVSGSETQESEREASTQPDQDIDAGTSEETVAVTPKTSDNAAPNFKSNGKKNLEKEKETVSGSAPQAQLTVPATRRSARLATKGIQNEDSSTQAPITTTTNPDTTAQPTTTDEATNTDTVADDTKPAPRRSSRIKKVPAQAASTPAPNAGPSTKDVVEAVSAVVSSIKAPAPAPKSKPTRGQKRKRTATSDEEEEGSKKDETGRSDGSLKKKSKAGAGTAAKGSATRKAKRARKSRKDEEGTTTRAGEKENTTENVAVTANQAQSGGQDEGLKDGEKKITIGVPVKAVKKTRGSKKTKA